MDSIFPQPVTTTFSSIRLLHGPVIFCAAGRLRATKKATALYVLILSPELLRSTASGVQCEGRQTRL